LRGWNIQVAPCLGALRWVDRVHGVGWHAPGGGWMVGIKSTRLGVLTMPACMGRTPFELFMKTNLVHVMVCGAGWGVCGGVLRTTECIENWWSGERKHSYWGAKHGGASGLGRFVTQCVNGFGGWAPWVHLVVPPDASGVGRQCQLHDGVVIKCTPWDVPSTLVPAYVEDPFPSVHTNEFGGSGYARMGSAAASLPGCGQTDGSVVTKTICLDALATVVPLMTLSAPPLRPPNLVGEVSKGAEWCTCSGHELHTKAWPGAWCSGNVRHSIRCAKHAGTHGDGPYAPGCTNVFEQRARRLRKRPFGYCQFMNQGKWDYAH